MKIGVLGGTFDPVHRAHIAVAEAARDALGLDRVILVPAGQPMSKPKQPVTEAKHRINMLRLAIKGKRGLEISDLEIKRPGPSYTIDTITELKKAYRNEDEIYFILGCDSLLQMPEWKEPSRLAAVCRLVTVPRPGFPAPDMKELEKKVPGISKSVIFLDKPNLDVSATDIRERIAEGQSIDDFIPKPVAEYIKKQKLYQKTEG
jgi:nicotinate-nucleotide adenylyltransferase